jgi:hypothetical protein
MSAHYNGGLSMLSSHQVATLELFLSMNPTFPIVSDVYSVLPPKLLLPCVTVV